MLTLYTSALMLLITLYPPPPDYDRSAEYSARITGRKWFYDGEKKRSNRPSPQCETWEFRAGTAEVGAGTVRINPCQGEARTPGWKIYFDGEDGYNKITVEGQTYIISIEEDTSSHILYMEFEERPLTQGARSLHKYFHARS